MDMTQRLSRNDEFPGEDHWTPATFFRENDLPQQENVISVEAEA